MNFKFHHKNGKHKYYFISEDGFSLREILSSQDLLYYKFIFHRNKNSNFNQDEHLLITRMTTNINLLPNFTFSLFIFNGKNNYQRKIISLPIDLFLLESNQFFKNFKYVSLI